MPGATARNGIPTVIWPFFGGFRGPWIRGSYCSRGALLLPEDAGIPRATCGLGPFRDSHPANLQFQHRNYAFCDVIGILSCLWWAGSPLEEALAYAFGVLESVCFRLPFLSRPPDDRSCRESP